MPTRTAMQLAQPGLATRFDVSCLRSDMHTNGDSQTSSAAAEAPSIRHVTGQQWEVSGCWTVLAIKGLSDELPAATMHNMELNGAGLTGLDSAGALTLNRWLEAGKVSANLIGWSDSMKSIMTLVADHESGSPSTPLKLSFLEKTGKSAWDFLQENLALLSFIGENAVVGISLLVRPLSIRWRTVFYNVQIDGFNALPIIGLTSFLLGIVVAYQGAGQLENYGANVFVVDLVGYAMLREFAPLISAIIIAGRSGSAYAAQIGTMVVTEEVDALSTIAINPLELLVIPKVLGLAIALPLLTVFADITGIFGGMIMAQTRLDIGFAEFLDRFGREMRGATLLLGIGKSVVFAIVIALIGCFQGFRAKGGADSVGRQTTKSVVQSIFLVIVADAIFSVLFNILDL